MDESASPKERTGRLQSGLGAVKKAKLGAVEKKIEAGFAR